MLRAFISGTSGTVLTAHERAFLREHRPCGLILFSRNCADRDQIRALVNDVQDAVGAGILVLIDQEGGRVQRLRPPLARRLPPGRAYSKFFDNDAGQAEEAAFLIARLMADELKSFGINTNCTPVADIPCPGADPIIGDRALGVTPEKVVRLARQIASGHLAGGVLPVVKHIPGHGRAAADSHLALPVVDSSRDILEATDFAPFRALADLPMAMTAHVVFSAIDDCQPASTSDVVTREVIRGWIGFDGLLMSDDVSMKALQGPMDSRAGAILDAGSDVVLHCNGDLEEMRAVATAVPELQGTARTRFERSLALVARNEPFDRPRAEGVLADLLQKCGSGFESV